MIMIKKCICLILAVVMCLSMCACGKSENISTDENNTQEVEESTATISENEENVSSAIIQEAPSAAPEEPAFVQDGNTIETENGKITFLGVEKAEPGTCLNEEDDENAYVIMYEVTNKSDEPREGFNIFSFDVYQNNAEVDYINVHYVLDSEQGAAIANAGKGLMQGGTNICGTLVVLNDNTPLTIYVTDYLDRDIKTSLSLDVQ